MPCNILGVQLQHCTLNKNKSYLIIFICALYIATKFNHTVNVDPIYPLIYRLIMLKDKSVKCSARFLWMPYDLDFQVLLFKISLFKIWNLNYLDCNNHTDNILHITSIQVYITLNKITFYKIASQSAVLGHQSPHCCLMLFPCLIWKNPDSESESQDVHYIGLWFLLGFITRIFCHILVFLLNVHEVITLLFFLSLKILTFSISITYIL